MQKRSRTTRKTSDVNEMAARIVAESVGDSPKTEPPQKTQPPSRWGRKGGLEGGKPRAARMSKEQLSESARKAALMRWAKKKTPADTTHGYIRMGSSICGRSC
jgi:hypothetical protein